MDIFMMNSFALSNDLFLFVIAQLLLWKRKISFSCSHKIISTRLLFRFISVNLHLHGIQVSSAPFSCLDAVLILFSDSVQYFSDDCIQGRFSPDRWRLYWSCKHWNFHENVEYEFDDCEFAAILLLCKHFVERDATRAFPAEFRVTAKNTCDCHKSEQTLQKQLT